MTDHAYTALTNAQQRAGHLRDTIALARACIKASPADHPRRPEAEAALARWEIQWQETLDEIKRLMECDDERLNTRHMGSHLQGAGPN